jgi:hypothetical protein
MHSLLYRTAVALSLVFAAAAIVYQVTASLPKNKLSDFYGSGTFPISYPNEWDKRHGRKGHGIWLHGTPSDTYGRAARASNGCVVLANGDLDALSRNLQIGLTPVIIGEQIEWLSSVSRSLPAAPSMSDAFGHR